MKQKPTPPPDLWAILETELAKIKYMRPPKPEGSFTFGEFCEKFKVTENAGRRRLCALRAQGKVKLYGSGSYSYYRLEG